MNDTKGLSMPLPPGPGFSQAMDSGNTFSQGLGSNQMATHRSTPPGDHLGAFQQNLQQEQFLKPWRSEGKHLKALMPHLCILVIHLCSILSPPLTSGALALELDQFDNLPLPTISDHFWVA